MHRPGAGGAAGRRAPAGPRPGDRRAPGRPRAGSARPPARRRLPGGQRHPRGPRPPPRAPRSERTGRRGPAAPRGGGGRVGGAGPSRPPLSGRRGGAPRRRGGAGGGDRDGGGRPAPAAARLARRRGRPARRPRAAPAAALHPPVPEAGRGGLGALPDRVRARSPARSPLPPRDCTSRRRCWPRSKHAASRSHRPHLHVGPGTFQPVEVEASRTRDAPRALRRPATTAARTFDAARATGNKSGGRDHDRRAALETAADADGGSTLAALADRPIHRPGYRFRVVDALLTNFHLPRSTLLCSSPPSPATTRDAEAYRLALAADYRFYLVWRCNARSPDDGRVTGFSLSGGRHGGRARRRHLHDAARRGGDAGLHARRNHGAVKALARRPHGRRAPDGPRQHVPPSPQARRRRRPRAWRPPSLHGLGRSDPHRLRRLPGVHLAGLRTIDEDGVEFRSHLDGSRRRFTPELVDARPAQPRRRRDHAVRPCLANPVLLRATPERSMAADARGGPRRSPSTLDAARRAARPGAASGSSRAGCIPTCGRRPRGHAGARLRRLRDRGLPGRRAAAAHDRHARAPTAAQLPATARAT